MRDNLVKIKDIEKMAKHIRRDVAKQHGISIKELTPKYIKQSEVVAIINQLAKRDEEDNLLVNCKILDNIFSEVYNWIVGIEVAQLASSGELEAYWNDEKQMMTFSLAKSKE